MVNSLSRRELILRTAMMIAAGGGLRPFGHAAAPEALPIIDTHQHVWDLEGMTLSRLKPGGVLSHNYLLPDYLEATAGLNIVQSVYLEVDVDPTRAAWDQEANYILALIREHTPIPAAAMLGGDPSADFFADYIARFTGDPRVKGVRFITKGPRDGVHPYRLPAFVEGVRLLGRMGLRFDLGIQPSQLPQAIALADDCPETGMILNHCGNADPKAFASDPAIRGKASHDGEQWKRDLAALAARPNVSCKISGIVARMRKGEWTPADLAPIVNDCLDTFGPDRVVFGSDWPVCTLAATPREWVTALKQIIADRPLAEQRKLLHDNALRVYGLA